jgi:ribosomal protein S18 acetylase RimI-like enzyme
MPTNASQSRPPRGAAVRLAAGSDERDLAALDHATWSWEVAPVPHWPSSRPFFDEGTRPENVLVAHHQGRILGYLKLRPAALAASSGHVQELHGMAVDPAVQGRGVGRLLLEAARQEATRRGARRITLRVLGTNTRARSLYRACGYRVEGVLAGEFLLEGAYVDDVLMALELTGAAP